MRLIFSARYKKGVMHVFRRAATHDPDLVGFDVLLLPGFTQASRAQAVLQS